MLKSKKELNDIVVLQQDQAGCGVACLLTLIRYYGGDSSLERLRELSGTSIQGTSLLGLYQAAKSVGFEVEGCESDAPNLIVHEEAVILHVLLENKLEHYVVCFGYENERFVIFDPSKGLCYYTANELEQVWESHVCLTLSPTERFEKKTHISNSKQKWIYHLLHKDFGILGISVLIGLVIAILGMTVAIFSQKLIDDIIPNKNYSLLWTGTGLVLFLLIARLGLSTLRQYLLYTQSKRFNNRIIIFFYNKLLHLPKTFFDTRKTGDMVARLNDTQSIQAVISAIAGDLIVNLLSTVVTLIFLFYYSWSIAVAFILFAPLLAYIVSRYKLSIVHAQNEVMTWHAHCESNFINTMQGIDTIKRHNSQIEFRKLNRSIYNIYQDRILNLGKINIHLFGSSGLLCIIVIVFCINYGSYQVFTEQLKLGEFMAIISLISTITPSIVSLALITIPICEAKVAFNRMFELIRIEPEQERGTRITDPIHSLTLQNISFRFAGGKQIIRNMSANFTKGELYFILGESGSGKTTLCHLLEKSYSPEEGKIIINQEYNLDEIAISDWRKHIGIIPQEVFIFNGTVLDNICLNYTQTDTEVIVNRCAKYGLDKYIDLLPQGYATIIGENGINLSGGQKQLIAVARLLIKMPHIMVLDEPTSAMDKELEAFIMHTLTSLKEEKIIIIASHRLELIQKYADNCIHLGR